MNINNTEKSKSETKYPYMRLKNGLTVAHSKTYVKDSKKYMNVYFEKPLGEKCLKTCCVELPTLKVQENSGFTNKELTQFIELSKQDAFALFTYGDIANYEEKVYS